MVFYLEDLARRPLHWKVVEHVYHRDVVESDQDVIHGSGSSHVTLSVGLTCLEYTDLSINAQSTEVDAPPVNDDNANANEDNADFINNEDDVVAHVLDDDDVEVSDDDDVEVLWVDKLCSFGLKLSTLNAYIIVVYSNRLPPSSLGVPVIGQSLDLLKALKNHKVEEWFHKGIAKNGPYGKPIFLGTRRLLYMVQLDVLKQYVAKIYEEIQYHLETHWLGKNEIQIQ
ncbi:hypothetical protein Tco_1013179, partial [Tanacetum coccineum]